MIKSDYHMHSFFSSDSDTKLEKQILSAIKNNLENICITDHMDFDFPSNPDGYTFQFDMEEYLNVLKKMQSDFADEISLYIGVELGIMPHIKSMLETFMKQYHNDLDFIIASSHLVNKLDPYDAIYFDTYGEKEGIRLYLQTILDNIDAFTDFDVYGHLDYVVRYAPTKDSNYAPSDYWDYFDAILKKLISLGKGIELNTAGLKAGLSFAHPHPKVLQHYRELGGEIITVGSDAHKPEHIAYAFTQADDILKNAGFRYYTTFQKRKPVWHKL